jgi:hypothetical protein
LLSLVEGNQWEEVEEEPSEELYGGDEYEDDDEMDEEEAEDELDSYVDEVAQIASLALERLAAPQLSDLDAGMLNRLANVPDLTLIDLTDEGGQLVVIHDLSSLRQAAKAELESR